MGKTNVTQVSIPKGRIDLGIGQPQEDILPLDFLARAAANCSGKRDRSILQYGVQQGSGDFRMTLADFLGDHYKERVSPDHLYITNGISQALDQICRVHTRPGDTVIVEEPSYFLALDIFADYQLNIVGAPIDENGIIIEALEEKLTRYNPVFLYTIPSFHNPSGVTLSADRREKLAELSQKYDFMIVADEVYQLLGYTKEPPLPMVYYDTGDRVFSLGSFSKILAPGLRLGWVQAAPTLLKPLFTCGSLISGGGLNPFTSGIVNSFIELGLQNEYLNFLRETYKRRMTKMCKALRRHVPSLEFEDPVGGFFIWGCLPDGMNAPELLCLAHEHNVGFQPGNNFSISDNLRTHVRLAFAYYKTNDLLEGVQRLARVIR